MSPQVDDTASATPPASLCAQAQTTCCWQDLKRNARTCCCTSTCIDCAAGTHEANNATEGAWLPWCLWSCCFGPKLLCEIVGDDGNGGERPREAIMSDCTVRPFVCIWCPCLWISTMSALRCSRNGRSNDDTDGEYWSRHQLRWLDDSNRCGMKRCRV
jgi:hypothetical protein